MAKLSDYLHVRVTAADRLELELVAAQRGQTVSEVLRNAVQVVRAHDEGERRPAHAD